MPTESPTAKRLSGKRVVAALLALIAVVFATAVALFFTNRDPSGDILAMRAAPGRRVVLIRRGVRDSVHAALHDARGRHVWSEPLFGAQGGAAPFVAGERVVVPARDASRRPATHVFELGDGRFVFRAEPAPSTVPSDAHARYAAVEGRLFELYPGAPGRLAVYELATGRALRELEVPAGAEALDAVGSAVVVGGASPLALDARSLEPTTAPEREPEQPSRARSLGLTGACLTWESGSGRGSIEASALGVGDPVVVRGADATIVRIDAGDGSIHLAAVDAGGALHVARVRWTEGVPAPSASEHVGPDALFLRADRAVVGLALPELTAPPGAEGLEVRAGVRASTGCDGSPTR